MPLPKRAAPIRLPSTVGVRPSKRPTGKGRPRLTTLERYEILQLHRKNPEMPYSEIARLTGRGKDQVRELCIAADATLIDLMASEAALRLDDWRQASDVASSRGDHRPAKEWLMHSGALEQLPDAGRSSGPAVVIINNPLPGMPGGVAIGTPTHDVRALRSDDSDR